MGGGEGGGDEGDGRRKGEKERGGTEGIGEGGEVEWGCVGWHLSGPHRVTFTLATPLVLMLQKHISGDRFAGVSSPKRLPRNSPSFAEPRSQAIRRRS